ncbi:MAG: DUF1292 domain-containing protein [Clostridiales bacterium]|nr:DUF1292 domain-containing protein [Lachnospiraceae bacterium]MDD6617495.1 DUF1292 domain-containing protein [Clostridiales bacterium]
MDKIKFIEDDGEVVEFFVEEQARIGGKTYLLVSDSQEEEAQAYIMKDVSEETDSEACYEFVEDDLELKAVTSVFQQMLDDVDIEL